MSRLKHLFLILFILMIREISANAVVIVDASDKTVLQLISSETSVIVVNQVATVTTTQQFVNNLGVKMHIKYAFPLYEDAAATSLRWKINGTWHQAYFTASPADTTLPGGDEIDPDLDTYLGETPLYFDLTDSVDADSTIVFELIYVQLLHYAYNTVEFNFPNNYSLISTSPLEHQSLSMEISSDRGIVGTAMLSHTAITNEFTESSAELFVELYDEQANADYEYEYYLDPDELGLFSFSTFLPDSVSICDNYGRGYFSFILEPDPGDTVIIQKVFTLIVDHSGSMSGEKIEQARAAANFVIDNLNTGDMFNIVEFNSTSNSVFTDHVPVTISNQNTAHAFIDGMGADGGTNIIGSFEMAIPQFEGSDDDVANIIIFMTDGNGQATTEETLSSISNLIADYEVEGLSINCFGIGYDVNEALLSQIASENNGIYQSFAAGDLLAEISDFYLSIQNPVLLNTSMEFDPPLVHEVYPDPLPNLYVGHQLIVVGRYEVPGNVDVSFSGEKYGAIITYDYSFSLTDSSIDQNLFLTKLWAIEKINNMMTDYYTFSEGSPEADSVEAIITSMSLCYQVVSPFTSFSDNGGWGGIEIESSNIAEKELLNNYPNPFHQSTVISFSVSYDLGEIIPCVILDLQGNIIRILTVFSGPTGNYEISWDGTNSSGKTVNPGLYPYYILIDGVQYRGIMEKI